MKTVVATLWLGGPVFILEDGTVMVPQGTGTGSCWSLDWSVSKDLTAEVRSAISGSGDPGFIITVRKHGDVVYDVSTAA